VILSFRKLSNALSNIVIYLKFKIFKLFTSQQGGFSPLNIHFIQGAKAPCLLLL
jgi:hypothetical protein